MEVKNYFATDTQGNVLGSAQVYLYLAGTTTLATGLQNISGASLSNPFTSDPNGLVQFKAPNNNYDLRVVKPGREFTIRIQCFDGIAFIESITNELDQIKSDLQEFLPGYEEFRSYTGDASSIVITGEWVGGTFIPGGSVDNGGTQIKDGKGRFWTREFSGNIKAAWFRDSSGNDSSASSRAAKAAPSYQLDTDGDYPLVPYCAWSTVELPEGTWTVTEEVDTGNKEIVWITPVATKIVGMQLMNGRILRPGCKITDYHHGILDSATSFSIMSNRKLDEVAPVGGIGTASRLSNTNGRDTVGAYVGNRLPAPLYGAASVASYSANQVVLSTPMTQSQLRKMRRGMIIHTRHSTRYAGYVTSFTDTTINVSSGWFLMDGSPVGTAAIPPGTDGVDVNVFRKAWGGNTNVFIDSDSYGNEAVGIEVGVSNAKGQSAGMGGNIATYCMLLASLKADANDFYNTYAAITGGKWVNGFTPIGGVRNAFIYRGDLGIADEMQNLLTGILGTGVTFFNIDAQGNIEAGRRGGAVASPWVMDMHSSGTPNDYDARISCAGGTSVSGQAVLELLAGQINLSAPATDLKGLLRPDSDLGRSIGQASTTVRRFLDGFIQRLRPGAGSVVWTSGAGSPEGVVTAPRGSMYTQTDGSGLCSWWKDSGTGATGWVNR